MASTMGSASAPYGLDSGARGLGQGAVAIGLG